MLNNGKKCAAICSSIIGCGHVKQSPWYDNDNDDIMPGETDAMLTQRYQVILLMSLGSEMPHF